MWDIIVVGAGPAGLTSALYALRANKKVLVLEAKSYGGQIVNASKIENYPGILDISGFDYATNLYQQVQNLGVEIRYETVLRIEPDKRVITKNNTYQAKAVIIATGSENRKLRIDREMEFIGKGISYCATCDGNLFRDKVVAVIGGGNTALEDALYLSDLARQVYLIHRRDEFRGEKRYLDEIKSKKNITLILNANVTSLNGSDTLKSITITQEGKEQTIEVDGLFIAIGQEPKNEIFANVVKLNSYGYIESSDGVHTLTPGVYVAGDTREKDLRQLTTAVSDGSIAAVTAIKEMGIVKKVDMSTEECDKIKVGGIKNMEKAKVYFTKNITPENVVKMFQTLNHELPGKVAVKVHSGEEGNQNYLRPEFMKPMIEYVHGTVVECNTAYDGARDTTEKHTKLMEDHGWSKYFDVDIMDSEGDTTLEIPNGKIIHENYVGNHLNNYDSMLVLSHFKGHPMGGYGGALKQLSIGVASGKGKRYIHCCGHDGTFEDMFHQDQDSFLESMADAASSVVKHFGDNILYINVMANMSVDCDCCNVAEDPCMQDIGILASTDPVAIDQACIDLVKSSNDPGRDHLLERINSRHGTHTIDAAEALGIGTKEYELVTVE